jgi:tetratricopeptide (TPR) repeat protein
MKLASLCLLLAGGIAQADEIDPKQAAAARYLEVARTLKGEGKLAEACAQYEIAFKAVASEPTLSELSECYRALTKQLHGAKQDSSTVCARIMSDASVTPSKETRTAVATCHTARADALIDAKDYQPACEAAEAAVTAVDSPANVVFAAGCHRDAGKLGRAWRRLLDAKTKLVSAPNAELDRLIVELLSAVRPGRVLVAIPSEATVEVDQQPITKQGISIAGAEPEKDSQGTIGYPLDAGTHTLTVTAAGQPSVEKTITIVDGSLERVTIEFSPPSAGETIVVRESPRKKIGWITIAAGGVVGLAGLYFGYDALAKQGDADDLCPTGRDCSQDAIDLNEKAGRSASISNVMVGVGLVGAAIGTYLVLTAPKAKERSARITPAAGPGAFGFTISGGF